MTITAAFNKQKRYCPYYLDLLAERASVLRKRHAGQVIDPATVWGEEFWNEHTPAGQEELLCVLGSLLEIPVLPLFRIHCCDGEPRYIVFESEAKAPPPDEFWESEF